MTRKLAGIALPSSRKAGKSYAGKADLSPPPKPELALEPELDQAIKSFLAAKELKARNTHKWHEHTFRRYGEYLIAENQPQWPPDPDIISAFLVYSKKKGLTLKSLDNYYRSLKVWLNWLRKRKRVDPDIIELIERPSKQKGLPKVVPIEAITQLLETLKQAKDEDWRNLRDYALIVLALDSGARIGELASFTLDRIDLRQHTIVATETKSGEDRIVVFSDQAAALLVEWLEKRATLQIPETIKTLFVGYNPSALWNAFTDSGMRGRLNNWQKHAGIPHFNFHRLRHSCAVYTLRAGGDLLDLQKQLGHANIATTSIYTRIDDTGRASRHDKANPMDYLRAF